jgi:hypothetical protein
MKGENDMNCTKNGKSIALPEITKIIFPNGSGYEPFVVYTVYRAMTQEVER